LGGDKTMTDKIEKQIRLSKLMAEKGLCSRREADAYIQQGLVFVNGERVSILGTKVSPEARVTLDTPALQQQKKLVTIILNKPIGYVSAQPEDDYFPRSDWLRLKINTELETIC
jgi:23S rRNA pseudouridine2604 synthase